MLDFKVCFPKPLGMEQMKYQTSGISSLMEQQDTRKHEVCLNMVFGLPALTLINYTLKEQGIGEWVIPFWEGQQHEYFSLNSVAKNFT